MTELIRLGLIVAGILALLVGGTMLVSRISQFFRARFCLNIWPGMIFLALSFVCGGYAGTALAGKQDLQIELMIGLLVVAVALLALAAALDIRRAGVGWGLLALCIQAILALCFVLVTVVAVFWAMLKKIARRPKEG